MDATVTARRARRRAPLAAAWVAGVVLALTATLAAERAAATPPAATPPAATASTATSVATHAGSDPTRPPAVLQPAASPSAASAPGLSADALVLQAVVRTPGRPPGALINGWILRPGDVVQGMRLTAVGDAHADVVVGEQPVRLTLYPTIRRQAAAETAERNADAPAARRQMPSRGTP